jgi:DNA-binding CsgD family transcriptional regulator
MTKAGKRIEAIITTKLINYEGKKSILGIVTDISERKAAEKLLHEKDGQLTQKTKSLEEMNIALGVLLEQREKEKADFKENLFVNLKKLVFPYIEKLEKKKLDEESQTYLKIVRSNLRDLMAPIANTLSLKYIDFTPTEIQVANLIAQGKTSKEIASMLNVSTKAVSFHRANIRKKLGLWNKKTNLRTFLQFFPEKEAS